MAMIHTETDRIRAVRRFEQFNFDLSGSLQGLLQLAATLYGAPAAFVTLIDEEEQLFKANHGFEVERMPRATSFCTHVVEQGKTMVVPDAVADPRFTSNPLVRHPPGIRFYAGSPLATTDGHNIGTICVMGVEPKEVADDKSQLLEVLAAQAIHLMELELTYKLLQQKQAQVEVKNQALMEIAFIQSHEFRGPLSTIMGFMNLIKEEGYQSPAEYLMLMEEAVTLLDQRIHNVVRATELAQKIYKA